MTAPKISGKVTLTCCCGQEISVHLYRNDEPRTAYVVSADDKSQCCSSCGRKYQFAPVDCVAFQIWPPPSKLKDDGHVMT